MNQEREINLWNCFVNVLIEWKKIMVFSIVFAILISGMGYLKSIMQVQNERIIQSEEKDPKKNIQDTLLKDEEIARVQSYISLKESFTELAYYNANSVLMQLDTNAIPTYKMTYAIRTKGNPILVYDSYSSLIFSEELNKQIKDEIGVELPIQYSCEIISVSNSGQIISDTPVVLSEVETEMPDNSMSMTIMVRYYDRDTCEKIGAVVSSYINDCTKKLEATQLEEFELIPTSETYILAIDTDLLDKQTSNNNTLISLKSTIDSLEDSMTEEEKTYLDAYQKLKEKELTEVTDKKTDEKNISTAEDEAEVQKPTISVKYVLLGAVLGAFIVVCFVGLRYILSNKLHYGEEIHEVYDIHIFGILTEEDKKKKGIDGFLMRMKYGNHRQFSIEEAISMIYAGLKIVAEKENLKNVFITGCCINEIEKQYIEKLIQLLAKDGVTVQYGSNVLYNPESLETLSKCDGVLLMEKVEDSTYNEIEKELEIFKQQKLSVLGAVVIE